jgi:CheY-like chemotaxis protein/ribosomal protein L37AE/L43A
MDHPMTGVVVCERNQTRAELYALWLDPADVTVALTAREAIDACDETAAVVILDQRFAGDRTRDLLKKLRSAGPLARIVETRDRASAFPSLGLDHDLVKPVFEDELRDLVEQLVMRANYHLVLRLYYQTTAPLLALQHRAALTGTEEDHVERLESRVERLKEVIGAYQRELSEDDIAAVKDAVSYTPVREAHNSDIDIGSKYRPDKCSRCREPWDSSGTRVTRLGAYVWRCGNCGHVQMRADPSHQDVGKYRR